MSLMDLDELSYLQKLFFYIPLESFVMSKIYPGMTECMKSVGECVCHGNPPNATLLGIFWVGLFFGTMMVFITPKKKILPYFLGGWHWGVYLESQEVSKWLVNGL